MIINLNMTGYEHNGAYIYYTLYNNFTNEVLGTVSNNINEYITLHWQGRDIVFKNLPKIIDKAQFYSKYPLTGKSKKIVGFDVFENEKSIAQFYGAAMDVKGRRFFKSFGTITLTVFKYNGKAYQLYRVGFSGEPWHWYILYEENKKIVGAIQRKHHADERCVIYIEDDSYLMINLIACVEETVTVSNSGNSDEIVDPSAGNYISRFQEEKDLFDNEFVERVKRLNNN